MRTTASILALVLLATACTKAPLLTLKTLPVDMPQPLRRFELKPTEFHDVRFVMFRDGDSDQRSKQMRGLISGSLAIYDMEIEVSARALKQAAIKKKLLARLAKSSIDPDTQAAITELLNHEGIEFSSSMVYLAAAAPGQPAETIDIWTYISTLHKLRAAGPSAELTRYLRPLTDPSLIAGLDEATAKSSANHSFLVLSKAGWISRWLDWSELRWKNGEIDSTPMTTIVASANIYNYQRTGVRIAIGKDAKGAPWVTIDDWLLNAIPDVQLREDPREEEVEKAYAFASTNAPEAEGRILSIRDVQYLEEGGILSFNLKTEAGTDFRFKVWRSKYDAPDHRQYYFGEVERRDASGHVRRGTARWIDRSIGELMAEADQEASSGT